MRYIQRLNKRCEQIQRHIYKGIQNKDVNKYNEIYTKAKQRCKQIQWDIRQQAKQWCKQIQWDIYKGTNNGANKYNEIYTNKQSI